MSKRVRGSSSRPGQRARLRRSPGRPTSAAAPTTARPSTLTPEEEARAAELEAQIVAEEKAAETATRRARERGPRAAESAAAARPGSLTAEAANEYAYVVRDIRKIVFIGGGLILLLILLWVVVEATGVRIF